MIQSVVSFIWPFFFSAGLILINEMGDKSQLLAMAFAARMKLYKVFIGIFFALLLLNGIAVAVGSLLASVPGWKDWVQFVSSILFFVFGLWTLKGENEDEEKANKKSRSYGDIALVFVSFFFSEMGDKTQLVTISLAARFGSAPVAILAGSTVGMLIADGIGIIAGGIAHRRLPEQALKIISAAIFIFFGAVGFLQSLRGFFMLPISISVLITAAVTAVTIAAAYSIYRKNSKKK
jgi:putative Ca2+/H+ antiporter (TMEM165/GDT1 family)